MNADAGGLFVRRLFTGLNVELRPRLDGQRRIGRYVDGVGDDDAVGLKRRLPVQLQLRPAAALGVGQRRRPRHVRRRRRQVWRRPHVHARTVGHFQRELNKGVKKTVA